MRKNILMLIVLLSLFPLNANALEKYVHRFEGKNYCKVVVTTYYSHNKAETKVYSCREWDKIDKYVQTLEKEREKQNSVNEFLSYMNIKKDLDIISLGIDKEKTIESLNKLCKMYTNINDLKSFFDKISESNMYSGTYFSNIHVALYKIQQIGYGSAKTTIWSKKDIMDKCGNKRTVLYTTIYHYEKPITFGVFPSEYDLANGNFVIDQSSIESGKFNSGCF